MICSPSKRTRQTWHGVALGMADAAGDDPPSPEVDYRAEVYDGDAADLLDLIQGVDDAVTTVMIIGHNPSISLVSESLDPEKAADLRTSGVAAHSYAGAWDECGPGDAPLLETHTARGRTRVRAAAAWRAGGGRGAGASPAGVATACAGGSRAVAYAPRAPARRGRPAGGPGAAG